MLNVKFFLNDSLMPRTEYWQLFLDELNQNIFEVNSEILIPHEDIAIETNWPRFGNPISAYLRGEPHKLAENSYFFDYFKRLIKYIESNPNLKFLYINMHPFFRVPLLMKNYTNVVVADVSLAQYERSLNNNTISMPTLPIVFSKSKFDNRFGNILASFQGAMSHPVRHVLSSIAKENDIIINFVDRSRHSGKIDAKNNSGDSEYEKLLFNSNFAFVPRGDALFSYRLVEVMSYGCIPIILSDGWILPFDRFIKWDEFCLQVHLDAIPDIPNLLRSMSRDEIIKRKIKTYDVFQKHFCNLSCQIKSLLLETEFIINKP